MVLGVTDEDGFTYFRSGDEANAILQERFPYKIELKRAEGPFCSFATRWRAVTDYMIKSIEIDGWLVLRSGSTNGYIPARFSNEYNGGISANAVWASRDLEYYFKYPELACAFKLRWYG